MQKILVIALVGVPLGVGLLAGARWVGVPRPFDATLVMFIALVLVAVEWYRTRSRS